jgi:hypothetical protein
VRCGVFRAERRGIYSSLLWRGLFAEPWPCALIECIHRKGGCDEGAAFFYNYGLPAEDAYLRCQRVAAGSMQTSAARSAAATAARSTAAAAMASGSIRTMPLEETWHREEKNRSAQEEERPGAQRN